MIKPKRCPSCNTYFGSINICRSMLVYWWERKYFLECNYCKWTGKRAWTKRGAVRKWNRDKERKKV